MESREESKEESKEEIERRSSRGSMALSVVDEEKEVSKTTIN